MVKRRPNKAGDPPNRVYIDIPLSPQHTKVVVYYSAVQSEHLNLYIDNVYKQTCYDNRRVGTCYFETFYTPGQVLSIRDESPYGWVFLGENLYFHFTNPNPTWSCNLGLLPHWYLYGQKNSCPATKGVAAHGSGSAEDCVCLPGSYSQANRSSPCLPCPPGTFADNHNMSQCTPCPANSWHDKTNQTNISVCLCNAGWVGIAANGCVECAAGTYETTPGTSILDCRFCKHCNASTNAAFTDHYDSAREGLGCGVSSVEVCTACPSLSSLFRPTTQSQSNFGVQAASVTRTPTV